MAWFSKNLDNLRKLYINQLQTLLSTEQQIIEALPKMIDHATDTQLKQAFQSHLQETREQAQRLEQILNGIAGEASPVKCKVMAALVSETETMVKDAADDDVRDAALISAGQRVEHYEIASYGAVRHWAQVLGLTSDVELLDKTIHEEGHADHLLTQISNRVNPQAEKSEPVNRVETTAPVQREVVTTRGVEPIDSVGRGVTEPESAEKTIPRQGVVPGTTTRIEPSGTVTGGAVEPTEAEREERIRRSA